ncbi:uncharacterized protein LOC106720715 [Papilio machaon]|uniref:uncharacterized protein LOC106720715 n=1 Tax=Papilio machaon TaxID=76193 RepID=UPI001E664166|nr:uncharacterized protein LOC106720715 [Papilio machaon]
MWNKLQDSPPFYLQFSQTNGYEISITDYITLYTVNILENEFITILKESNPKLEITDKELMDNGVDMLSNLENIKDLRINTADGHLKLYICKFFVYPFRLNLTLHEAPKEIFFQKVTQHLLRTIIELRTIEQKLRESLKKKDEEIDKYNMKGYKIEKYRRTTVFNEEEHLKMHEVFKKNGVVPQDIPISLLEKKGENKESILHMKQETNGIHDVQVKQEATTSEATVEANTIQNIPKIDIKEDIKRELQNNISPLKKRKKELNL